MRAVKIFLFYTRTAQDFSKTIQYFVTIAILKISKLV